MKQKKINIPGILEEILKCLIDNKIRPILVGGCVRDFFLNLPSKDYDVELFNVESYEEVSKILIFFGNVKLVGKKFGVLTLDLDGYSFDFALARQEKKIGSSHRDFEIVVNSKMSFREASKRRDFTINSIGYDYENKVFLDPNNGIKDIKNKVIKHIDEKTFIEDSLRVYRAIAFASRFNFNINKKTFFLCEKIVKSNEMKFLPKERIYQEFNKIFLKSKKPSVAFKLIKDLNVIKYFPQLNLLVDCSQDKEYHPEGDVFNHTMMVIDEMANIILEENIRDEYRILYLFYAVLCHDFGKPYCTKKINDHITSYKHEVLGENPTKEFLKLITNEKKILQIVVSLVVNHMAPFQLYSSKASLKALKKLSLKVNIEDLCLVAKADCLGRDISNKNKCYKSISWMLENAKKLNIENNSIKPLIKGKDLICIGIAPSKEFKEILEYAFELQLDKNYSKKELLNKIKNKYILNIN